MVAPTATREASLTHCHRLGLPINPQLPLLEDTLSLRPKLEIVDRSLCVCAMVYRAYGFPEVQVEAWIDREALLPKLSPSEVQFLHGDTSEAAQVQWQVEGLFAFAWLLSLVSEFEWDRRPPDTLINVFPDLRADESSARFRGSSILRPECDALAALDCAYCVHWAAVELALIRRSSPVEGRAVQERRRVIEWCLGSEEWDEVSLDT